MREPAFIEAPNGRRIACHRTEGKGPGVVFLGGLRSDMEGSKALFLQSWAEASGRAFVRFDYSGHGQSPGRFAEGCIGDWLADAGAVLQAATRGPQVLVGSSMGGWIALALARARPDLVAGLVGIAAAPDFTEDDFWARMSADQRAALMAGRSVFFPSDQGEPFEITRRMIEDGRENLVLRAPLDLPFPVRLLHGTADASVPVSLALRLMDHAASPDLRLTLVKGADHRFSSPECLDLIRAAIEGLPRGNAL